MKKILAFVAIGALAILGAAAQNLKPVHGYVIDKNTGSPIVGAEVSVPGGGETTITDADGSFNLTVTPYLKKLEAKYDGMQSKKMKVNFYNDMVFEMKKERQHPGFINLMLAAPGVAIDEYDANFALNWGLMGGQLGKWGWYAKTMVNLGWEDFGTTITAGAVKQLKKNKTYMYFGAGFGCFSGSWYGGEYWYNKYDYYYWEDYNYFYGVALDLGFIFRTSRHFNITVGLDPVIGFDIDEVGCQLNLNLGIGYVF